MQAKTERYEMRLDEDLLSDINAWRARQGDVPPRAEAIRRLIEKGLVDNQRQIQFTKGETLIIQMLCDVFKGLKIKSEIDPNVVQAALSGGLAVRIANEEGADGDGVGKLLAVEGDALLDMGVRRQRREGMRFRCFVGCGRFGGLRRGGCGRPGAIFIRLRGDRETRQRGEGQNGEGEGEAFGDASER